MSKVELPKFTIRQLLEAGAHFGHKTMRRNPKMSRYIHTSRNGISIIDLNKTATLLHRSLKTVKEIARNNGRILFVATKKQAAETVAEAAKRCGQYYVNFRWLGGMLTNWKTISHSIKTLKKIEEQLADTEVGYNKKEKLVLERKRDKLERALGGIKNMGGYPDLLFVIDTQKEALAIAEATKLNVPIMAIVDTNCNPEGITFPIPGNDDSAKSIRLFSSLISDSIIAGIKENMVASGVDLTKLGNKVVTDIAELRSLTAESKKAAEKDKQATSTAKHHKKEILVVAQEGEEEGEESSQDDNKKASAKKPMAAKAPVKKAAGKFSAPKSYAKKMGAHKKAPAKK